MDKIDALVKELTLEEKVSILSGSDAWHTTPVERPVSYTHLTLPTILLV